MWNADTANLTNNHAGIAHCFSVLLIVIINSLSYLKKNKNVYTFLEVYTVYKRLYSTKFLGGNQDHGVISNIYKS